MKTEPTFIRFMETGSDLKDDWRKPLLLRKDLIKSVVPYDTVLGPKCKASSVIEAATDKKIYFVTDTLEAIEWALNQKQNPAADAQGTPKK